MMMTMSELEAVVNGKRIGANSGIMSIGSDSRQVVGGELFVALRGEQYDGHQFVTEALRKGAIGALVDNQIDTDIPQVVVNDTELSLGKLASNWRLRFDCPVVAVTGSNGKTTVKEMIGSILRQMGTGLVSHGNFNNTIGLPLSLLELREEHRFAAVEIGMNQIGEIEYLAKIASPNVVVITNATAAHLENLESIQNVAEEKGNIISGLVKHGTAVLNADDEHFELWRKMAISREQNFTTFAINQEAEIFAEASVGAFSSDVKLNTPLGTVQFVLNLPGEHNVKNSAAAAAAAIAAGATRQQICAGLESIRSVKGRLCLRKHVAGGRLLDDTYNANPASLKAALDVLSKVGGDRRLVIGDMLELGTDAEEFHRVAGIQARQAGIGRVYAMGPLCKETVEAFGRGGDHYETHESLIAELCSDLHSSTTVLVKGSRGMQMERVVRKLVQEGTIC